MLSVVIEVQAPGWAAQGVKEQLAMMLERFGDCRVVSVEERPDSQVSPGLWVVKRSYG